MVDITTHLNQFNTELQGRGNIVFYLLEEGVSFEREMVLLAKDIDRRALLHFQSLSQYKKKTNVVIDKEFPETAIPKMNESFLMRFQDIWEVKKTLAFISEPLNVKATELRFYLFEIEIPFF